MSNGLIKYFFALCSNMVGEFVVRLSRNTYPRTQVFDGIECNESIYHSCYVQKYFKNLINWLQELPWVYADEGFHGKRDVYLVSAVGVKFRVRIVTPRNGPMVISGPRWRAFALANLNENVHLLHFVEEGDDCYYVTGYNEDGTEFAGYNLIGGRFPRFMSRVTPYYDVAQVFLYSTVMFAVV